MSSSLNRSMCSLLLAVLFVAAGALFAEESISGPLQYPPTFILLPMQIGDKASLMVLDTAAEYSAIDNSQQKPDMKALGKNRIQDASGAVQKAPFVEIPSVKFRTREWTNVSAAMLDFHDFSIVTGVPIAGCLGVPELNDSKLFIDYEAMKLTMHKGDSLLKGTKAQELLLLPDNATPTFKAIIEGMDVKFEIDTGQNSAVTLESSVFERFVEKGLIKKSEGTGRALSIVQISRKAKGTFTGGELMGKSLKGLLVHSDGSSLIGVRWLTGFRTEIDFPGKKLRFVQVANERNAVLVEQMLGAILGYSTGRAAIMALKPGGKGVMEVAGFQVKDEVFSMGEEKYLNWHVVQRMLEKNAGTRIKIEYKRPGAEGVRAVNIQLPGLITEWNASPERTDTVPNAALENEVQSK